MKKVKFIFAASALATIGFFAFNSNESVAGRACQGRMKMNSDGTPDCGLLGTGCSRLCRWYEIK